jgi:hypothetical protein
LEKTMANAEFTTPTYNTDANSTSGPPHASSRANPDTEPDSDSDVGIRQAADGVRESGNDSLVSPLEAAIEEERSRLMLADSVLGCLQIALDTEAIRVTPVPYFPEVLELAREFLNKSVRRLDYEEIRRLLQSSMGCYR